MFYVVLASAEAIVWTGSRGRLPVTLTAFCDIGQEKFYIPVFLDWTACELCYTRSLFTVDYYLTLPPTSYRVVVHCFIFHSKIKLILHYGVQ